MSAEGASGDGQQARCARRNRLVAQVERGRRAVNAVSRKAASAPQRNNADASADASPAGTVRASASVRRTPEPAATSRPASWSGVPQAMPDRARQRPPQRRRPKRRAQGIGVGERQKKEPPLGPTAPATRRRSVRRDSAARILDPDRCLHARPPRTPRGIDRTAVLTVGATSCLPCIAANPNFCNQWPQLRSIACSRRRPRPLLSGVRVVAWPCCRGPHRLRLGARPAQSADSAVACRIFLTLVTPRMRNPSTGRPQQGRPWSFPRRDFAYRAGHPRRRGAHRRRTRALPSWLRTSALPAWSRPSGSPSAPASTP